MLDTTLIDKLTTIKSRITELTAEKEKLEAEIILTSSKDLENTKYKTVTYASEQGNKITATIAETLKLTYPTLLKKYLEQHIATQLRRKQSTLLRLQPSVCSQRYGQAHILSSHLMMLLLSCQ